MLQSTTEQHVLSELDLEPMIIKAMDSEEGHGWSFAFACQVAKEYADFLYCVLYTRTNLSCRPSMLTISGTCTS